MEKNKIRLSSIIIISGMCLLAAITGAQGAPAIQSSTPTESDLAIWNAIQQEVTSRPAEFLFTAYDWELSQVTYSDDGMQAVVWLDPLDPITGMTLATEPMVVIAERTPDKPATEANSWTVTFSGDTTWSTNTARFMDMLPQELTMPVGLGAPEAPQMPLAALGGYKLPWAAGLIKTLVWSAEHASCPGSDCVYAFDFSDGTMFPLLAAKGGSVFYAKDSCANGVTDCTNMLILKDVSTSPVSYQIYYHLAHASIPASLHNPGAVVSQGQFIGLVDDTGYSSGHHLHFMVHTNPYGYWGQAVDITFRDVTINWDPATQGGRPRTEAGAAVLGGDWQNKYTSGNVGTNPPTGGLKLPNDKTTVDGKILLTTGWGSDNIAVTRLQLIAYFNDAWHEVGTSQAANPFNYPMNICSAGIPIGPFDLALRVWDYEGNQSANPLGIRHLVNTVDCPDQVEPVCEPDSNQAALFSDINFSGTCRLLGIGNHSYDQFAPVADNDVASVILGENVQLRMYDGINQAFRRESITNSDRNLSDNSINLDHISSVSVQLRTLKPVVNLFVDTTYDPHGPSVADPKVVDSITVTWHADGATKYQTRIFNGTLTSSSQCEGSGYLIARSPEWSTTPTWSIGTLQAGNYTWCVRGRIIQTGNDPVYSDWQKTSFTVTPGTLPARPTHNLPYVDDMDVESDRELVPDEWIGSGLWRHIEDPLNSANMVWASNNEDNDIGDDTYGGGDLTSPPIQIPSGGATLRFNYRYETESDQGFWDQRWVQISRDGGLFQNLIQLSGDPMNTWLTSPDINLTDYAGSTVRIRFHFSIVDKYYNGGLEGWLVDNISVTVPTMEGCEEPAPDTLSTALPIGYGDELSGSICPAGDIDYYQFTVSSGDKLIAMVKALQLEPSSQLNSHLTLVDQDKYGNSPILENNDMQDGVMTDSQLYFVAPENGTYYLKVKSGDYPTGGGGNFFYNISLVKQPEITDNVAPSLVLEQPSSSGGIRSEVTVLSALAGDTGSGVSQVDFWWHSPNWTSDKWTLLSSDAFGEDGWQSEFDGSPFAEGQSIALAAIATDWEGNSRVVVDWNVPLDNSPPATTLNQLPDISKGNGVYLSWTATDTYTRLGGLDVAYQPDGMGWLDWQTGIPGDQKGTWFVGEGGHQYDFMMRGLDLAGNQENFPGGAETSTILDGTCSPDPYDLDDEGDDNAQFASPLDLGINQPHNYCEINDVDWVFMDGIQAGQTYLIMVWPDDTSPLGSMIDLYQTDEGTLVSHWSAKDPVSPLMIKWQAPADGRYLIKLSPLVPGIMGNNTGYNIRVGIDNWYYFPAIHLP